MKKLFAVLSAFALANNGYGNNAFNLQNFQQRGGTAGFGSHSRSQLQGGFTRDANGKIQEVNPSNASQPPVVEPPERVPTIRRHPGSG